MNPLTRIARRAAGLIGLAAILLGLAAAPAWAAPKLEVGLTNDANEVQRVIAEGTTGQFRLDFGTGGPGVSETGDIKAAATPQEVKAALNGLENVKTVNGKAPGGGGSVAVAEGAAPIEGRFLYYVNFGGGPLGHEDVPELAATNGTVPLGGAAQPRVLTKTVRAPGVSRSDQRIVYLATVKNSGDEPTTGPVTLALRAPAGEDTFVAKTNAGPTGWSCLTEPALGLEPAVVTCTRSDALATGASYPTLEVTVHPGAEAPDPALAEATVEGGGAAAPAADSDEIAIDPPRPVEVTGSFDKLPDEEGDELTQAGGHPLAAEAYFATSTFRNLTGIMSNEAEEFPIETPRSVVVDAPRGFVGNVSALPELCPSVGALQNVSCPPASAVGGITIQLSGTGTSANEPIYAIQPDFGHPAEFAFLDVLKNVYTFWPRLRPAEGYAITIESAAAPDIPILEAWPTLCSYGAKVSGTFAGCKRPGEPGANAKPLITLPTRCQGRPKTVTSFDSWQHPGDFKSRAYEGPEPTGCEKVEFTPRMRIAPTSAQADSPTGLTAEITMPTNGLEGKDADGNPDPEAVSQANLKSARITFPVGMSVNSSAAQGLGGCSLDQVGIEAKEGRLVPNDDPVACPESSKIGTIEVETPILEEKLVGDVYLAKQGEEGGALIGLFLVFDNPKDGILIKLPGRVDPDPVTGQLVSTFDESVEAPFTSVKLSFPQGPRSPLVNPPRCGQYQIKAEFAPWSAKDPDHPTPAEIVTQTSSFEVSAGPDGGPCPSGALEPALNAGVANPQAGQTSPFSVQLTRPDGSDRFTALNLKMPPGLSAYLTGVPYCPDSVLASIPTAEGTGQAEIEHPSCPAASQIGTVLAGAGAGPSPFYTSTGKAYLAGPYRGAPLSIATVTPAVAGPLDLGNVVVRSALYVNPETAQVSVVSDPIPTILHGLLLDVRDLRVQIDRPHFTLNPTNCEPQSVGAAVSGLGGATADLSNRFQVGNCGALAFKPKLGLSLKGGTRRNGYPALTATLNYPPGPGYANVRSVQVALPHSEFLAQEHIRTVCTRVQFAAHECPAGSIYGHAEATTPLLEAPLTGPVYLRSSSNKLPDLVVALKGPESQPIEVVLDGRVDSVHGGIRTSFEVVPDAPVSKFVLSMQGGKKGLLVNSTNICEGRHKATVRIVGQNGKRADQFPAVKAQCGKKTKQHAKQSNRRRLSKLIAGW